MDALTVGKALATISVGWAALFSVAHTDIDIPVTEITTETETTLSDNYYPAIGCVCGFDKANDLVIYTDCNGNEWDFPEIQDWEEGDMVALIMNDKGTEGIYDDEPVTWIYCGRIECFQ